MLLLANRGGGVRRRRSGRGGGVLEGVRVGGLRTVCRIQVERFPDEEVLLGPCRYDRRAATAAAAAAAAAAAGASITLVCRMASSCAPWRSRW